MKNFKFSLGSEFIEFSMPKLSQKHMFSTSTPKMHPTFIIFRNQSNLDLDLVPKHFWAVSVPLRIWMRRLIPLRNHWPFTNVFEHSVTLQPKQKDGSSYPRTSSNNRETRASLWTASSTNFVDLATARFWASFPVPAQVHGLGVGFPLYPPMVVVITILV